MIILLGMPGAGKTTQTRLLAESLGCPWFSMGELIREHATGQAREEMLEGRIIDDKITLDILSDALDDLDLVNKECLVEGNPRSIPQADWWLAKIKRGEVKLTAIINLTISPKAAEDRIADRGRVDDDDAKIVHKRLAEYNRSTAPTIAYLKSKGVKIYEIDGSGSIDEIANAIKRSVKLA